MINRPISIENQRVSDVLTSLRQSFYDPMQRGFLHEPAQCYRNSGIIENILSYQLEEEILTGEVETRMAIVSNGPLRTNPWPFVLRPNHKLLRSYELSSWGQTTWDFHWMCYLRVYSEDVPYSIVLDSSTTLDNFGYAGPNAHIEHLQSLFKNPKMHLIDTQGNVMQCIDVDKEVRHPDNIRNIRLFTADIGGFIGELRDYTI